MGDSNIVELPSTDPRRLASAIQAVLAAGDAQLPTAEWLQDSARAATSSPEQAAAQRFQALLELGYLAASADGLDAGERAALAALLENVTGKAVDAATLDMHFKDLDAAASMLGRRERLARVAADLGDHVARAEAIAFAALVAMADGRLAEPEMGVLVDLGASFSQSADQVRRLVDGVAASMEKALR
jgi:hypothetical protein